MTMQRHFQSVVDVPHNSDLTPWQAEFMRGVKQNMDLLIGATAVNHTAVVRGDIEVQQIKEQNIGQAFDSDDYARTVTQLNLTTRALNRLISEIK